MTGYDKALTSLLFLANRNRFHTATNVMREEMAAHVCCRIALRNHPNQLLGCFMLLRQIWFAQNLKKKKKLPHTPQFKYHLLRCSLPVPHKSQYVTVNYSACVYTDAGIHRAKFNSAPPETLCSITKGSFSTQRSRPGVRVWQGRGRAAQSSVL